MRRSKLSNQETTFTSAILSSRAARLRLAKRKGEVSNVKVIIVCGMHPSQVAMADPEQESLIYMSSFFSNADRQLSKKGDSAISFPATDSEAPKKIYKGDLPKPTVVFVKTAPMDANGFFNFGTSASYMSACVELAEKVVVETNECVPTCRGRLRRERSHFQGGFHSGIGKDPASCHT